MTWISLEDGMPTHPKMLQLTAGEFALHVEAICYCGRHLTDGVLPTNASKTLRFWSKNRRERLVERGVWDEQNDGKTVIHDYDQYQRTKAQVQAEKESNRQRQERYRQRHRNGVTDDQGNALVTRPPNLTLPKDPLTPTSGGTEINPRAAGTNPRSIAETAERESKRAAARAACRRHYNQYLEDGETPARAREWMLNEYRHDPSIVAEALKEPA